MPLRPIRDAAVRASYVGSGRWCPICGRSSRKFRAFGRAVLRQEAQCIHCKGLERHRFVWLYLQQKTDLFDGRPKVVLHVAPEPAIESLLRGRLGSSYVTADLEDPRADLKIDITDIGYPDDMFDVVYCSHVLEHIPDDRKAMRELRRVLKPSGWAVLQVPVVGDHTYEDESITSPAERLKMFGLEDHVRQYGRDFADRLRDAGFGVSVIEVCDMYGVPEAIRMGLGGDVGEIYLCRKA